MRGLSKVTMLFLVLTLCTAAVGIGYAQWTDTIKINASVSTGNLLVGVCDIGTDDDRANSDFVPNADPTDAKDPGWVGNALVVYDKDVGNATSQNVGSPKFNLGVTPYYGATQFTISNVYPSYAPLDVLNIANGGSVPVKVKTIVVTITESMTGGYNGNVTLDLTGTPTLTFDPLLTTKPLSALWAMDLVYWGIDVDGGALLEGSGRDALILALIPYRQIDPGHFISLHLRVHFTDTPGGHRLPQNDTITMNTTVTFEQWNLP